MATTRIQMTHLGKPFKVNGVVLNESMTEKAGSVKDGLVTIEGPEGKYGVMLEGFPQALVFPVEKEMLGLTQPFELPPDVYQALMAMRAEAAEAASGGAHGGHEAPGHDAHADPHGHGHAPAEPPAKNPLEMIWRNRHLIGWPALIVAIGIVSYFAVQQIPGANSGVAAAVNKIGGWFVIAIIISLEIATFMECLRRNQQKDWWVICLLAPVINVVFGWQWLAESINAEIDWLNPRAFAFAGVLATQFVVWLFTFDGGRDFTATAVFAATSSLLAPWLGWGAMGVLFDVEATDANMIYGLFFAMGLQSIDIFKPHIGNIRITTLVIAGAGVVSFEVAWYLVTNAGQVLPTWVYWMIGTFVTFIAAAIGSDYANTSIEQKPGSVGVLLNVAERLWKETQFEAVVVFNIAFVVGVLTNWI